MKKIFAQLKKIPFVPAVFFVCVIAMSAFAYYHYASYINTKIAWKGYGPQDYVAHKLYPENFANDFQSGIKVYDNSLPMRLFVTAAKHFNLSPDVLLYPYMFFHTLLFAASVYFLAFVLFTNHFVSFMATAVCLVSFLPGANISKFGTGFWSYLTFALFYAYANALRIFSIGFFLKNRYMLSFLILAASMYCHFTMGLFVLCAYGFYFLLNPKKLANKKLLTAAGVFALIVTPLFLKTLSNATGSSQVIPFDEWLKYTKMFSCHWYPSILRIFTNGAKYEFFSLAGILALVFFTTRFVNVKDNKHKAVFAFTICWLLMSATGVFWTINFPSQFIVMLSLQRSTSLITFLGTLYLINYIYGKLSNKGIVAVFAAFWALGALFFSYPGLAIAPYLVMFATDLKDKQLGCTKAWSKSFIAALTYFVVLAGFCIFFALMCVVFNQAKGSFMWEFAKARLVSTWYPMMFFDPWSLHDYFIRGGMFRIHPFLLKFTIGVCTASLLVFSLKKFPNHIYKKILVLVLACGTFWSVWHLSRDSYTVWKGRKEPVAKDYLNVQLWAKNNTPKDALFMPDPAHFYGWRDFSLRSSFGNLREWGHNCLVYDRSNVEGYKQGIERIKALGVEIDKMKYYEGGSSGRKLNRAVKKRHYNMSAANRTALANKFGIDYFIFEKAYITPSIYMDSMSKFKVAYQNRSFLVLEKGQEAVKQIADLNLKNFKGPRSGPIEDLPQYLPGFSIKESRQNFTYQVAQTPEGAILKILPIKDKGPWRISLGYESSKNGFHPKYKDFDMMLGVLKASCKNSQKAPPVVLLGDHTNFWSTLHKKILSADTADYSFAKTMRENSNACLNMIQWLPDTDKAVLEIKEWKIY